MIPVFLPVKKLRRNGKCLLFGAIVLVGAVAVYNELVAASAWRSGTSMNGEANGSNWRRAMSDEWAKREQPSYVEDLAVWRSGHTAQTWKPEYMGQANLHVFEDWCGSTTAELRKNPHYPLYPHSRTTVQKLAVSPQWTNYGLRIFGYLHPYADGEMVFALASNDNSEFWLSTDDSPLNLQLLAWVGKTGTEWTAPGEFNKYVSQISRPVRLSAQRRYFFEVIHKQNYKGADHVEVAWQLPDQDIRFMIIESKHISLYVDESAILTSDVAHIPQTAASHQITPTKQHSAAVDMLREDPRDVFYQVPLINSKFLQGVLPDCSYKPSYTIKDFPLLRYQGLQFVHMSYIYPNDFTRLTHMETENSCFYPESNYYMRMFGFSGFMRLDRPDVHKKGNAGRDFGFAGEKSIFYEEDEFDNDARRREREARPDQIHNALFPDYGDDFDDYAQKRRRKLFAVVPQKTNNTQKPEKPQKTELTQASIQQTGSKQEDSLKKAQQVKPKGKRLTNRKANSVKTNVRPGKANHSIPVGREQLKIKERPAVQSQQILSKQRQNQRPPSLNQTRTQRRKATKLQSLERDAALPEKPTVAKRRKTGTREVPRQPASNRRFTTVKRDLDRPVVRLNQRDTGVRKGVRGEETGKIMPLQQDFKKGNYVTRDKTDREWLDMKREDDQLGRKDRTRQRERDSLWGPEGDFDGADDEDLTPAPVFDTEVNWSQTFQINHVDIQALRSDWIDLHCNVTGNMLLHSSDALPMVTAFLEQLNKKHQGRFTLVRVVNVVKRVDKVQGNRYLVELELKDADGRLLRLSQYIYALIRHSRQRGRPLDLRRQQPELVLCNPVGFRWNPLATVHFIVPVKNQARWVQMLIADMERLFTETGDANFNLIIADYNSTDMDVRKALQKSSLPRYQYVKLGGNFERSAGLQAGVDLINDNHSIVFLCDLHIHFPPSIIDTIRKHCVEGHMAFAPIVMRLDCGATPLEARGYWEVNGFGLLGIYKSDLDAIGGMNTVEFTDRWGGEDWELLDRILQAGLEVERIHLRNFFHYYHSKRGMWNRRKSPSHT